MKKECEALKEELHIRKMKKGLKKKQYILVRGSIYSFFPLSAHIVLFQQIIIKNQ